MHAAITNKVKAADNSNSSIPPNRLPNSDMDQEIRDNGSNLLAEEINELDLLKREKVKTYYEIERYKKVITYAVIFTLFSFLISIVMVVWRFTLDKPSFEEVRQKIIRTDSEEPRLCITVYPNSINKNFTGRDVGQALFLTPLIEAGKLEEAAEKAKVQHIMQTTESYSGFLTINKTLGANLFFWYFPSVESIKEKQDNRQDLNSIPLVLWLQGGPGWPSMYGLFKENGPFLCGFDEETQKAYLVDNKFSWTKDHHMLYIDNPVGAGFSFTEQEDGYPKTDEELATSLLEAVRQFMIVFPYMTHGQEAKTSKMFAFGESYGGTYVVSLARALQMRQEQDLESVEHINLVGVGIGNGFLCSLDQSLYADYVEALGYVTEDELKHFRKLDDQVLESYNQEKYADVILSSQEALHFFASSVMNLTNIYDFTFDGNYLTNNEYVCFLQQDLVRRGIHVGNKEFNKGYDSYSYLNQSVMVSKKPWLNQILDKGMDVLIYNGNLDFIVHVLGTSRLVKSLKWGESKEFHESKRQVFWVYNEDAGRGEIAGYFNEGGGLTYMVVRNAGHMVPISQPRWARQIVYEFTHKDPGDRFQKPHQIKRGKFTAFKDCSQD